MQVRYLYMHRFGGVLFSCCMTPSCYQCSLNGLSWEKA